VDGLEGGVGRRGAGDRGGERHPVPPQGHPEGELSTEGSAGVRCVEQGDGRVRSVRALLWEGRVVRAEAMSRYT